MISFLRKNSSAVWLLAAITTLAAMALHVYFLGHAGGLWRDEVNTVNLATRHSVNAMSEDSFPILMPLVLRVWTHLGFGSGDIAVRFFGMLVGLSIVAAFWLASWNARRSPPLIALALFALNSIAITYTDSLRPYGLGSLCIALTAAAACFFLHRPTWRRAGVLSIACILSVQTLYQNAVFVAAVCAGLFIVAVINKSPAIAIRSFSAGLMAAVSLVPYWRTVATLPEAASALRTGFDARAAYTDFDSAAGFPLPQYLYVWEALVLLIVLYGLFKCVRRTAVNPPSDNSVFAAGTLVFGIGGFALFLWYAKLQTQPWYFLPLLALVAACIEIGLPSMPRALRPFGFGLIAATACIAAPFAARDLNWRFTDVDALANRLQTEASQEDYVIVTPWIIGISFDRYFKGPAHWDTLPLLSDHSSHRYDLVREQMQETNAIQPVLDRMAKTLQNGHRVWIVGQINYLLKAGAPAPANLPPPPLARTGWSDMPYRTMWSLQAAQFLADHCVTFEKIVDGKTNQAVNFQEAENLYRATGWRNPAQ